MFGLIFSVLKKRQMPAIRKYLWLLLSGGLSAGGVVSRGCFPVAMYGPPPPCKSDQECINIYGSNWYCAAKDGKTTDYEYHGCKELVGEGLLYDVVNEVNGDNITLENLSNESD